MKRWILLAGCFSLLAGLILIVVMRPRLQAIEKYQAQLEEAVQEGDFLQQAQAMENLTLLEAWKTTLAQQSAEAYLLGGDTEAAIRMFDRAERRGAISAGGRLAYGDAYLTIDQPEKAILQWKLAIQSGDMTGYQRLDEYYRGVKDWTSEVGNLEQWIGAEPMNGYPFLQNAYLQAAGGSEEAPSKLRIAMEKNPDLVSLIEPVENAILLGSDSAENGYQAVLVGRALGGAGNWDLAELAFRRAIDQAPEYAEAWAFLSEARYQQGLDGLPEIQKALEMNPNSVVAQALYALRLRREGHPKDALPFLQAVAKMEPNQIAWREEIGRTLAETGDINAALAEFQAAVDLQPNNPEVWKELARFCIEYNFEIRGTGLQAARQALALQPEDAEALDLMGWTMFLLEDTTSAERFLHRSLEADPGYAGASLHLGQVYLNTGQEVEARQNLTRASRLASPGSETKLLADRLLERYFGITETSP